MAASTAPGPSATINGVSRPLRSSDPPMTAAWPAASDVSDTLPPKTLMLPALAPPTMFSELNASVPAPADNDPSLLIVTAAVSAIWLPAPSATREESSPPMPSPMMSAPGAAGPTVFVRKRMPSLTLVSPE